MKTQLHHELLPPCCQLATAMFHGTFSYLPFVLPTIYIGGKMQCPSCSRTFSSKGLVSGNLPRSEDSS